MTRACHIAVRAATGQAFTDEEIDDLLDRMSARAKAAGKAEPSLDQKEALARAAADMTKEELRAQLIEKRLAVSAAIARTARRAKLDAMPTTMGGAKKLEALAVGSERQGLGTSSSIDAEGRARQMTLWGQVDLGLKQMPGLTDRISNFWMQAEKDIDRLIAREIARLTGNGAVEPTGDEGALHAARVFVSAQEAARKMLNDAGAWVDQLPGYIARQLHDPGKIAGSMWGEIAEAARAAQEAGGLGKLDWDAVRRSATAKAFGAWRDFILPRLDPKTFDGLEDRDVAPGAGDMLKETGMLRDPADLRERMLFRVWMDIVTGRHAELSGASDLADFRPPSSRAGAVSRARVLHFKDPDAWVDYQQRYGRGSLFATVMGQLERAGRNSALMKMLGPSPEAAWTGEVDRLSLDARDRGDVKDVKELKSALLRARFDEVNGTADIPDNMRLAQTMRSIRSYEALAKLGGIVLSKATDLPMTGHTFARAGAGFLAGYRAVFTGVLRLSSEEGARAADALDVGARSFAGHMGGQYQASDGMHGWLSQGTRLMYRINGFDWFNNGVRRGAAETYARFLGQEAKRGWDGLQQGTRETFERFGITPEDWKTARQGLEALSDGRTYFDPSRLDPELALKFRTMIHNVLDDTVSEPRARERSGMTRGSAAGTVWGEIQRSFFQFKGFVNAIVGRHLVPAARGYAGYSPVSLMAHMIIGSTLAGYVSMNMKMIARGEAPKSIVGDNVGDTLKIWGAAFAQGGGLGLYGDFLFGELNRNGNDFDWGAIGGPMLSDSEQLAKIVRQSISGGAVNSTTGRSQIPGELVKLGSQNIPLINLWYTRVALDYLVLWRLQEAASPGYLQRYEDRVRDQEHSRFLVSPTSAL